MSTPELLLNDSQAPVEAIVLEVLAAINKRLAEESEQQALPRAMRLTL
ncbi:hypothetical protein [Microbulbifer sp. THAF38]|nr:hypothetical protein [Microbulbifer sp. THAF38]QFT55086.1 hypothetical protein FIU95_11020 [Microbulbifer sp. THAF38]